MQFRFDEDQLAMRDAVRALCADRLDLADVAGREEKPADATTWSGLVDLGIFGMLAEGPASAIGLVEAALVFEELGAHLVTGPVLWSTLAAAFVPGVAEGDVRVAGVELDETVDVRVVVEHAEESEVVLVIRDHRIERFARAELGPSHGGSPLDPLTPVAVYDSPPRGEVVAEGEAAHEVRRTGAILGAAMLVGAAQGSLDVARSYALEREQFGVAIGSFQAVKHLLADMFVRVELARAATYAAAAVAAGRGAGDPDLAAGSAKFLAGDAGVANGRAAVQVLGGMGFTWEMLPHYFLKRAFVLDHAFGTASSHAAILGAAVGKEVAGA